MPALRSARHLLLVLASATWCAGADPAGSAPAPFLADGMRAHLDLAGTWEAGSTAVDLAWPPRVAGWAPQAVPHWENRLISHDEAGPYWPHDLAKIVDGDGEPAAKDRAAAWFRRSFTVAGSVPAGMRARLHLDGVAWRHKVVLNGEVLGGSPLGLVAHAYDVTAVLRQGANELAIGATSRAGLYDRQERSFVAPFAGQMPGIYDRVRLELVPEARCESVFVRTSIARKRIELDLELVNDGQRVRVLTPVVAVRDPYGTVQLALTGRSETLAPGARLTATLGADWLAARLWSVGSPNLHRAEVRLEEGGRDVDRTAVSFGYREFAARGTDFTLNGRRQVLLRNSWLRFSGTPRDDLLGFVNDEFARYNCIRLHLAPNNSDVCDQADRTGVMVIPEFWGWYQLNDRHFPLAKRGVWQGNAEETMRRVVKRMRNHPSIVMWSLANETMWNSTAPAHLEVCRRLVAAVRSTDPTRLLQGDAEITWDGLLDAVNIHYPEGDTGPVGKTFEMSGWVVPNDLDWLRRDGPNHAWRADFAWDRPLMLGEFYARDGDEPERYTPYAGDAAYDRGAWRWKDFGGRDAATVRSPWIDMVKMSCDHYRAAGVACLNPWTGRGGDQLLPPLLVAPLDHHPNAFAGEVAVRRIFVANDHHQAWNDLHVQAALLLDGREVWSERRLPANCGPGEAKRLELAIRTPALVVSARARLVLRLCWTRGAWPLELYRHEEDLFVVPRPRLGGLDAGKVALLDPAGTTAKALAELGLHVVPGVADDAALAGKRLLIVGEGAAEGADLTAAARFARRGGRVLVLHQDATPIFIPGQPAIDPRHAASFSWKHAEHPAIAGLDERQLRHWRPDHLVATRSLQRPAGGAARTPVACGGRFGMRWSPLVELGHGTGRVTFCQYLLTDRASVEPAAATILAQAVAAGLATAPVEPAPPLRLIGVGKDAAAVLTSAQVATVGDDGGAGPVLLDLTSAPDAMLVRKLRAEVEGGRTVWLRGLDEKTLDRALPLLPWRPGLTPLPKEVIGAARCSDHPLIAGLGSADLYWARGPNGGKPTTALGGPQVLPPQLDAAIILVEPALLLAVPVGKGFVLIDQLAWDKALSAETERVTRIVAALAGNCGAGFRPPGQGRDWRFTGLDLSRAANRSYVDELAGDGVGGWTDQGDNDLRYFLINHTGLVGGMAVAGEPFPTRTSFHGTEFLLVDPKANGGRAVIVLRGGAHRDPTAPAEVRGLAAGNATADRVWFLHTAAWPAAGGYGTVMARYEIVYADGSRAVVPVRVGQEINDWWNPLPMSGAQVAWTGRNEKAGLVGIYSMGWDNPHPAKPIASIDVVGDLAGSQLVLLAIALGSDAGAGRAAASWDLGVFSGGVVPATAGGEALSGTGSPVGLGGRTMLRLAGGQAVAGRLPAGNPLVGRRPMAIELEVVPEGAPGGSCGGLVEVGVYQQAGLRLVLDRDLRVVVEQWSGSGPANAVYLKSREPLATGRLATVRYEHDGAEARLLVDGQLQEIKAGSPPAPFAGGIRIGVAGGKDYWINAAIGVVRLLDLAPPGAKP